jgi:hypothetical protein
MDTGFWVGGSRNIRQTVTPMTGVKAIHYDVRNRSHPVRALIASLAVERLN